MARVSAARVTADWRLFHTFVTILFVCLIPQQRQAAASIVPRHGLEVRVDSTSSASAVELHQQLATWAQPEDFPAGDALLGDSAQAAADNDTSLNHLYHAGVRALLGRSQPDSPDELDLSNAAGLLSIAANGGQEDAQSSMALLHGEGLLPPGMPDAVICGSAQPGFEDEGK